MRLGNKIKFGLGNPIKITPEQCLIIYRTKREKGKKMDEYIAEATEMKRVPLIYFGDNPCYLESAHKPNSHKIGECEIEGKTYNGFATKGGYFHIVKKEVSDE
jgi:hypothetical protein